MAAHLKSTATHKSASVSKTSSGVCIVYAHFHRVIAAPYLLVMYKNSVGRLMLAGDNFTFEDALGRMTRLPCSQFQEWNVRQSSLTAKSTQLNNS